MVAQPLPRPFARAPYTNQRQDVFEVTKWMMVIKEVGQVDYLTVLQRGGVRG